MRAALIGYHCEDETDVALLYSTIDSRITSRTVPEINNSYRSGHIRLEAYSKTFVTKCASGLRYSLYGINHSQPLSPVEHGELLLQNIDFIEDAGKIIGMKSESTQHMWRSPVVFAMHRTYLRSCQVDKDLFFEFWTEVRSGAKVRGSMPDLLREHLLRKQVRGSNIVHASGLIDRASMARMCIEVWNRWRKGSKLKSLKSIKMKGKFPKAV